MDADRIFEGSIPAFYDRYLGPMIFAPYADDLASRLAGLQSGRVLETAAGTGIVTRALNSVLPANVTIDATDLNQPMLDHASRQFSSARVTWQQADAQSLPFPDGIFDVMVCQFGAMFFPDKPKAFAEAYRVLKPGGRFLFSVWDRIETNIVADVVVKAVAAQFPDNPPMFLARTPHGFYDVAPFETQLRALGFTSVASERVTKQSVAPDAMAVAAGLCQGTPMRAEIDPTRLAEATEVAAAAIVARFGAGRVVTPIQAYVITATR